MVFKYSEMVCEDMVFYESVFIMRWSENKVLLYKVKMSQTSNIISSESKQFQTSSRDVILFVYNQWYA